MCNTLHMHTDDIIAAILQERRARRMTQAELAERAGISRRALVDLESGKRDIGLRKLIRILDSLGLSLAVRGGADRPTEAQLRDMFREDDDA